MRRLFAVALFFLLGCASMPSEEARAHRWERLAAGAATFDATATAWALRDGARELNPLLGKHPSDARLVGTTALSHLVIRFAVHRAAVGTQVRVWRTAFCLRLAAAVWDLTQH